MSFIQAAREQLLARSDVDVSILEAADLNEILLNNRAVSSSSTETTVRTNLVRTSDTETIATEKATDPNIRIQNPPNPDYKIPILYGRATFGGALVDVAQVGTTKEFQFVFALSMITGNNIAGTASSYELLDVFVNDQKINFAADGQIAASVTDTEGNTNANFANKLGVYVFANSSNHILPNAHLGTGTSVDARNVFPGWTPSNEMQGFLFAIVRIVYDEDLGFNEVPDIRFDIRNSLTLPGDVLYDFLTNNTYGCGIVENNIRVTSL